VSCHWIRSRSTTELLWIVGNKKKFNQQGIVPVNSTTKDLLHSDWENHWQQAHSIQILAVLGALLHDIGKATKGFQRKLKSQKKSKQKAKAGDPYRHEWISLHLFVAIIKDCHTDRDWLLRLANLSEFLAEKPNRLDKLDADLEDLQLHQLPPLAQLVGWLIVTHHRLPFWGEDYFSPNKRKMLRSSDSFYLKNTMEDFYEDLLPHQYWVKNFKGADKPENYKDFFVFKESIVASKKWQGELARWANKALNHPSLFALAKDSKPINNPFIMHLARVCLMIGDHNFSSLSREHSDKVVTGDTHLKNTLLANTDVKTKQPKQALDQHLMGVAKHTARFARQLPQLAQQLPALDRRSAKAFRKRTATEGFQWQNRAADLATKLRDSAQDQGFFGVNMVSTGLGKTLGNARIIYNLADPKVGARFTIALGLRVLTLQTGKALMERLALDKTNLAVLVGSAANRKLFQANQSDLDQQSKELEHSGSESQAELVDEQVQFSSELTDSALVNTIIKDPKLRDLLLAPIVSCTIDHIIGATENTRSGKQITPILRLLSSDLILDEPDDFDQADLPALARLVHMAGLLGSKVLLSSATLTPDQTTGLFKAYSAGRYIWNQQMGLKKNNVICAWFDEDTQSSLDCDSAESYQSHHQQFVSQRVKRLEAKSPRRIAEILPVKPSEIIVNNAGAKQTIDYLALAKILTNNAQQLHSRYHDSCKHSGKTASIGLIRMANIEPLIAIAKALYSLKSQELFHKESEQGLLQDTQIHLCCYHARQLLILRNELENKLDRLLNRKDIHNLFQHSEIAHAASNSQKKHHIFIVLATSVAEVGRDHDYDWAIIEPSSMRSIIQLAGRLLRHRPNKQPQKPNIKILNTNIKALKSGDNLGVGRAVFVRPGFEQSNSQYLLNTHRIDQLVVETELQAINAIPRISKPQQLKINSRLADLEHGVMADLLNNPQLNFVNAFWHTDNSNYASAHLQKISPFRDSNHRETDYICLPDSSEDAGFSFVVASKAWETGIAGKTANSQVKFVDYHPDGDVHPWLNSDLVKAMESLGQRLGLDNVDNGYIALRYATVRLRDLEQGSWKFHPLLGFWYGD